jgi:hypothetical protein
LSVDPLPARACGDCTVCCTILAIAALKKPAGVTCVHCDKGCAIHPTRPQTCRDFYCGWRTLEIFPERWRPDLSGVFAQLESEDIPAQFETGTGISLMLVGDNPVRTLRQGWFQEFVRTGIAGNIPLFLALSGPPGHDAAKLLLNDEEMAAALDSSLRDRIKDLLEKALRRLQAHGFRKR